MVRVSISYVPTAWMNHGYIHVYCHIEGFGRPVRAFAPDLVAYLVNKYAVKIDVKEEGYGFEADLPEKVALALEYLLYTYRTSMEELDEIAKTGVTPIHRLLRELGAPQEDMPLNKLFEASIVSSDGFTLRLHRFPTLQLCVSNGEEIAAFTSKDISPCFLKRVLSGALDEDEKRMLLGIAFLALKSKLKYLHLLSDGKLKMDQLAKVLFKSAVSAKDKDAWKSIADWLERNGYGKQASEIIARKTVCG